MDVAAVNHEQPENNVGRYCITEAIPEVKDSWDASLFPPCFETRIKHSATPVDQLLQEPGVP